ncbi:MAG: ABC transporter permease [Chloroflexi bacterium]|nr:ABC transporter permease [Chloroflexota bacterium]
MAAVFQPTRGSGSAILSVVLRRLAQALIVLFLVSIVAFALVLLTGDPVAMMLPVHASEADRVALERELGLDRPLVMQYAGFLAGIVHGDLGQSIKFSQPVGPLIASKLPVTLVLVITSMAIAIVVGLPLGILAGSRPHGIFDALATVCSLLAVSLPTFWIGLILILVFADRLRLLPMGGSGGLTHLVMPAVALSAHSLGLIARLTRASVLDERRQPYVTTARSKGLAERIIGYRHVLRNAMIPTVTVVGLQFGALIGGSVIIETVFSWPGIGWLLMQGVYARDVTLVRALVLLIGAIFIGVNLLVDLSYRFLDPRIRA